MEHRQEVLCDLSNSTTCNDREWHWQVISATEHLSGVNISKNAAYIAYEINYNNLLSYYCRVWSEMLFKITFGQVNC